MISGRKNSEPRKFGMKIVQICPPHLSDVATLLWEIQKVILTVLFIHTCDYLCYLRRKQTVIHLPTSPENGTTLICELQNFFYLTGGLLSSFKC